MLKISHFLWWNREYQTQFYASNTDDIKSFTQDIYASVANATDILFILNIIMGKYTDIWSFCSILRVSCNITIIFVNNIITTHPGCENASRRYYWNVYFIYTSKIRYVITQFQYLSM